jgi:hypothetical protein
VTANGTSDAKETTMDLGKKKLALTCLAAGVVLVFAAPAGSLVCLAGWVLLGNAVFFGMTN